MFYNAVLYIPTDVRGTPRRVNLKLISARVNVHFELASFLNNPTDLSYRKVGFTLMHFI